MSIAWIGKIVGARIAGRRPAGTEGDHVTHTAPSADSLGVDYTCRLRFGASAARYAGSAAGAYCGTARYARATSYPGTDEYTRAASHVG